MNLIKLIKTNLGYEFIFSFELFIIPISRLGFKNSIADSGYFIKKLKFYSK